MRSSGMGRTSSRSGQQHDRRVEEAPVAEGKEAEREAATAKDRGASTHGPPEGEIAPELNPFGRNRLYVPSHRSS